MALAQQERVSLWNICYESGAAPLGNRAVLNVCVSWVCDGERESERECVAVNTSEVKKKKVSSELSI